MTTLTKPNLGTPKDKGWPFYSLHLATSYLLKEYFLVSNYRRSIELAFNHGKNTEILLNKVKDLKIYNNLQIEMMLGSANELSNWAITMKEENYHELYVHSFIGMWSSFESGIENILADFINNDLVVAEKAISLFKAGRFNIEEWPWDKSICLEIAQKLEPKAKNNTEDGGINYFKRIKTLFSWFGISIEIEEQYQSSLSEANRMRNIILHRYGEISEKDAIDFPCFSHWIGQVKPLDKDTFNSYYKSMSMTFISLLNGIQKKLKNDEINKN